MAWGLINLQKNSLAKICDAQIKKCYFSYYHVQPSRKYVKGKFKNISIPKSLEVRQYVGHKNYKTCSIINGYATNFDKIKIIYYVPSWNYKQFSTSSNPDNNGVGSSNNNEPTSNTSQSEDGQNEIINLIKKNKTKQSINKKESKIVKYCNKGANVFKITFGFIKKTGSIIKIIIFQPSIIKMHYDNLRKNIKHTVDWIKTGILLFLTNMKISKNLIIKRLKGHRLSYSEYKLLIRTINDMFKLIPFSFFIIVPFAEFLLPVVLKIYPNLLPSTFKNNDDNFNNIKKNLYAKQQLSKFLQQLIEEKEKQLNENIGIDSDKKKKKF